MNIGELKLKKDFSLDNYNSLNDFMFYKYMCEEGNEKQQKIFLEALGVNIKGDLIIKNERIASDIEENKDCILDFIAETENNTLINIELQLQKTNDFKNRLVFYLSRLITKALKKGENYNQIKKVVIIAIVNFNINKLPYYYHQYNMINRNDIKDILTPKIEIIIIELKKFRKINKNFNNKKHLYLTFIDNETSHYERKELAKMDEGLRAAVKKIEEAAQTEGALSTYYKIEIERMARENEIEEGIQKGIQKGIKEGKQEEKIEIAIKLKKIGLSLEDIVKVTDLDLNFIENL